MPDKYDDLRTKIKKQPDSGNSCYTGLPYGCTKQIMADGYYGVSYKRATRTDFKRFMIT